MNTQNKSHYIKYSTDTQNETELCIDDIYVAPELRGQGLARKMIEEAIQYARDNGYKTVGLYAEPQEEGGIDGDALIEFYRSCGFESDADSNELMTYEL